MVKEVSQNFIHVVLCSCQEKEYHLMKRELFSKKQIAGLDVTAVANKTIVLPFDHATYAELVEDPSAYKALVNMWIQAHPELFPATIGEGWSLYGFTRDSVKQAIRVRRIVTKADGEVWHIRPSFVMPYMTCDTATAEKILFLAKWAPDWALARVFEKDVMTIERLKIQMGRYNLVGTTVKTSGQLPHDLVADETHSRISGETVYIATTVAKACFLGASVSPGAGEEALTAAYRQFQREAHHVQPDYQPATVNTDGWKATMKAWRTLFPAIGVIQCFLHAILGLRQVTTKATKALYGHMADTAWQVYEASTKRSFSQRLRRLREWGETLPETSLRTKLLKLCAKKASFLLAYDVTTCLRTSNMIDRLMRGMDKYLVAKQGFHGTLVSAEYGIRAYCLLTNFRPTAYNPIAHLREHDTGSPFEQFNGFTYHSCWLQNMLIATSRQEIYRFRHKKL
jgi:hypothetical protein